MSQTGSVTLTPDKTVYIRAHWSLAAIAMAAGMAILWAMGNPHVWTGAIGGLAAIALRGWYLMDEELARTWTLSEAGLSGPQERSIAAGNLATVRTLGHTVQIVERDGTKHLIKFQRDPKSVAAQIETLLGGAQS